MRHYSGWVRPSPFAISLAFVCAPLGTVPARAQGPPIVRSIDVQYTGPGTVSKERILAQIRTKVGQPYSDLVVQQDIENLYKTGAVLNVRIFAQPEGDGVKVIVAVQTRAVVREIEIDGAERVNAKRLRKEIEIKINQPVDEEALERSRQKLIDVYKGRGFNDVPVPSRVDDLEPRCRTSR